MIYVLVVAAAAAVGGLVYWASLRFGLDEARPATPDGEGFPRLPPPQPIPPAPTSGPTAHSGFTPPAGIPAVAPPPPPGSTYLPLDGDRRSWRTRVFGVVALLTLVVVAALALAFSLYQAGAFVVRLIDGYATRGG